MEKELQELEQRARKAFEHVVNKPDFELWERMYLGRSGELAQSMKKIAALPVRQKKEVGKIANEVKHTLVALGQGFLSNNDEGVVIDTTIPGIRPAIGHAHPLSQVLDMLVEVFVRMGFDVVTGPEVELVEYNFDLLNIPKDHPARDMWDTFYVESKAQESVVLRTHTSPVQVRAMEGRTPPVRLVVPGRVFRHEATDASHETNFYQLEGLVIDKGIQVAHLLGTLQTAMQALYGDNTKLRLRPSFFPFVEPGFEVDISCMLCTGAGCSLCKHTGWVEMLGAGMVHPVVLRNMKIDPAVYSGFAFGMGVDRMMLLKYQIPDIRLSYSGDIRFVKQF